MKTHPIYPSWLLALGFFMLTLPSASACPKLWGGVTQSLVQYRALALRCLSGVHQDFAPLSRPQAPELDWRTIYTQHYPLHASIRLQNEEGIRSELSFAKKHGTQDYFGQSPAHYAAWFITDSDLLSLIFMATDDVNAKNKKGQTPLSLAILKGNANAVAQLIAAGASTDLLNESTSYESLVQSQIQNFEAQECELRKATAAPKDPATQLRLEQITERLKSLRLIWIHLTQTSRK